MICFEAHIAKFTKFAPKVNIDGTWSVKTCVIFSLWKKKAFFFSLSLSTRTLWDVCNFIYLSKKKLSIKIFPISNKALRVIKLFRVDKLLAGNGDGVWISVHAVAHCSRKEVHYFLPALLRSMLPLFSIMTLWSKLYLTKGVLCKVQINNNNNNTENTSL